MEKETAGPKGERLAKEHYLAQGYAVLAQNYRTRQGEIDLIAQTGETLVFVEVKARGRGAIAAPREWVNAAKQRRMIAAAGEYLQTLGREPMVRFDVVEVLLEGSVHRIHCIENAFTL